MQHPASAFLFNVQFMSDARAHIAVLRVAAQPAWYLVMWTSLTCLFDAVGPNGCLPLQPKHSTAKPRVWVRVQDSRLCTARQQKYQPTLKEQMATITITLCRKCCTAYRNMRGNQHDEEAHFLNMSNSMFAQRAAEMLHQSKKEIGLRELPSKALGGIPPLFLTTVSTIFWQSPRQNKF